MADDCCVLFPVDVAESTKPLLSIGGDLATIGIHEIRLLHVVNTVDAVSAPDLMEQRRSILRHYRDQLKEFGIQKVTGEVVVGTPWVEIVRRASGGACSLVVMGSHGKGLLERVFLGSQTENVLHHGDMSLLVVRLSFKGLEGCVSCYLSPERLFTRILYATDFSDGARRCIPFLERVSAAGPDSISIAHVQDIRHLGYASDQQLSMLERQAQAELETLRDHFRAVGYRKVDTRLTRGNAISELFRFISENQPTLLVVGAKGSYGIVERALGGVSDTMVHRAPLHVAIIR